jgi:adenine/guanine/hypoxanthine permease
MGKLFRLKENGTTAGTEVLAGVTTFFTMVYIVFVNPSILSATGMPFAAVFLATIIAAAVGTLVMGLYANVPYALAPGMGLNAFFTFTVCFGLGFKWQEALALVFLCGVINVLITVTRVRKEIIKAIPEGIQMAIGGGIGVFIAYIGMKEAHFLQFTSEGPDIVAAWAKPGAPASIAAGDLAKSLGGVVTDGDIIPALASFASPHALVALIGLAVILVLLLLRVKGAILIGVLAASASAVPFGLVDLSAAKLDASAWGEAFGELGVTFGAAFGSPGFGSLFSDPARLPTVVMTVFAFSLSDTFDTIGTFIGTGRATGIFDANDMASLANGKGLSSKMDKALFADSIATSVGAVLGTSNTTTYIESAAGIEAGGRTGLTSVVTALLFLSCILLAPFAGLVPAPAIAAALIAVGILMMGSFAQVAWGDPEVAIPAFFAAFLMAFSYSISTGIAAAFIFHCLVKIVRRKAREVHPILYGAAALFVLNFVLGALRS